ncbi:MAG: hypothetical protein JHC84_21720, partial [Solirubrobacteraceae bacterium]|nr:hypothetical protein [Solirubrobacteraceae bacterium]
MSSVALTTSDKGGIAELKIAAAAASLGIVVARPMVEGRRYDLIFDTGPELLRVQCKAGKRDGDIVRARLSTSRHTPRGYVTSTYTPDEIEGFAIYCPELDECYYVPIRDVLGRAHLHLRLHPARNNQTQGVKMAAEYRFGAIAQLGERLAGSQKVVG